MKRNYIARRFQLGGTGLSLDTEALSKYKDIIDLSIGDTDFTTDEAIISAAFRDAGLGHTHYGAVSYTHLRAHETRHDLVCRLLLEKKKFLPKLYF